MSIWVKKERIRVMEDAEDEDVGVGERAQQPDGCRVGVEVVLLLD